jgi:hypothetical protein
MPRGEKESRGRIALRKAPREGGSNLEGDIGSWRDTVLYAAIAGAMDEPDVPCRAPSDPRCY